MALSVLSSIPSLSVSSWFSSPAEPDDELVGGKGKSVVSSPDEELDDDEDALLVEELEDELVDVVPEEVEVEEDDEDEELLALLVPVFAPGPSTMCSSHAFSPAVAPKTRTRLGMRKTDEEHLILCIRSNSRWC